jgi:transposase InsO family protein
LTTSANAYAERFIRTVRTECLDWILIRNGRHLERILIEFVDHYNAARPHRGIDLEVPVPWRRARSRFTDATRVRRVDRLSGLVHEYSIAA